MYNTELLRTRGWERQAFLVLTAKQVVLLDIYAQAVLQLLLWFDTTRTETSLSTIHFLDIKLVPQAHAAFPRAINLMQQPSQLSYGHDPDNPPPAYNSIAFNQPAPPMIVSPNAHNYGSQYTQQRQAMTQADPFLSSRVPHHQQSNLGADIVGAAQDLIPKRVTRQLALIPQLSRYLEPPSRQQGVQPPMQLSSEAYVTSSQQYHTAAPASAPTNANPPTMQWSSPTQQTAPITTSPLPMQHTSFVNNAFPTPQLPPSTFPAEFHIHSNPHNPSALLITAPLVGGGASPLYHITRSSSSRSPQLFFTSPAPGSGPGVGVGVGAGAPDINVGQVTKFHSNMSSNIDLIIHGHGVVMKNYSLSSAYEYHALALAGKVTISVGVSNTLSLGQRGGRRLTISLTPIGGVQTDIAWVEVRTWGKKGRDAVIRLSEGRGRRKEELDEIVVGAVAVLEKMRMGSGGSGDVAEGVGEGVGGVVGALFGV